jgi:hypothetical protein
MEPRIRTAEDYETSKLDAHKPYLEDRLKAGVWNAQVPWCRAARSERAGYINQPRTGTPALDLHPLKGHIGLQNHDPGSRVQFRNLFIQKIGAVAAAGSGN